LSALTKLFSLVDSNEAEVRRLRKVVEQVNALKAETAALSDDELRSRTALLREQLVAGHHAAALSMLNAALNDIDAATDVVTSHRS